MMPGARISLWSGKQFPYDAEVEYLETPGEQFIKTDITSDLIYEVEYSCRYSENSTTGTFVSVFKSWDRALHMCLDKSSSRINWTHGYYYDSSETRITISDITRKDLVVKLYKAKDTYIFINGVQKGSSSRGGLPNSIDGSSLYFFGTSSSYVNVQNGGRLYYCKIRDLNNVIIHDFIPVRKDDLGYLFDRVSGRLFGNSGTGAFIIGPDKAI